MNLFADKNIVRNAIPVPCTVCASTELRILQEAQQSSDEAFWFYTIPAKCECNKCMRDESRWAFVLRSVKYTFAALAYLCAIQAGLYPALLFSAIALWVRHLTKERKPVKMITVPLPVSTVGIVERAVHGASTAQKGSEGKAHGAFIAYLATMDLDEVYKQSLCAWAPPAIGGYMGDVNGVSRKLQLAKPRVSTEPPQAGKSQDSPTAAKTSAALKPSKPNIDPPQCTVYESAVGNPDVVDGAMMGTQLKGDEYGEEDRVKGVEIAHEFAMAPEPKPLAYQIGPDLIPSEVMDSTAGNLKAGMAKRVKPLPFRADARTVRKIDRVVNAMISQIFTKGAIINWRQQNGDFFDMGSKKWSSARFRQAYEDAMAEVGFRIEQEFQIKNNEVLPAKDKAPRPIIQTGDKGQMAMLLPVKCFETLLFQHFKKASIKGMAKHDAMAHFAEYMHIDGKDVHCIEGDGSAWDACCNPTIRKLTENRICEHIVEVLGSDYQVPYGWMKQCTEDMAKNILKGKAKVKDGELGRLKAKIRVKIEAIRQSGHRGTSAFNWLINFVCWIVVLCDNPQDMIRKSSQNGNLATGYVSSFNGENYQLKYKFEGDDSAICSTQDLREYEQEIEKAWTALGFRMKLVYVKDKMTFTGFNFLCNSKGPTGTFCPEVARNVASSSWTTSSLVKMHPLEVGQVGMAAMLARAENFVDCGPFSNYFAQLGLAHAQKCGDRSVGDEEAIRLGINPVNSVVDRLNHLASIATSCSSEMKELLKADFGGLSIEQEANMIGCTFGNDPLDVGVAKRVLPPKLWDPTNFSRPRR